MKFCDDHEWVGPNGSDCPTCSEIFNDAWLTGGATTEEQLNRQIADLSRQQESTNTRIAGLKKQLDQLKGRS